MPTLRQVVLRTVTAVHTALYRASGGRLGATTQGQKVLLLTVTGRKTGMARTTPLSFFADGADLVVMASNAGAPMNPTWWLNLSANPDATVELNGRTIPVRARRVIGDAKNGLLERLPALRATYDGYQAKTTREIPLISLEPGSESPGARR